ncbi:MAG: phage major capsid protein [Candidatus Nucleicultricaceae bacterium]
MKHIHDAIENLSEAYQDFKNINEGRIAKLEEKSREALNLDVKLDKMTASLDGCVDRLHVLSRMNGRPMTQCNTFNYNLEEREQKSAFKDYVCSGDDRALLSMEKKGLSTQTGEEGGFSVPQIVVERIRDEIEALSPMRRLAQTITISSSAVDLLIDHGRAEVGWVQELAARAETQTPHMRKLTIPVHEMYANPRASQKLLDDSQIDVESWLVRSIAIRMAQMENIAFIQGDGKNKPRGFLNYEMAPQGKARDGQFEYINAGKVEEPNYELMGDLLLETVGALKPLYHKGAVWLMSRSMLAMLRKIKDHQGHYILQQSMQLGAPNSLLGYPIEISDDMPAFSPEKHPVIAFGNFKEAYQIVDRAQIQLLRDPFSAKPHVEFYATKRVGGDVINFDALKMLKFIDQ